MKISTLAACGMVPILLLASPGFAFEPIVSIAGQVPVIHPGEGTQQLLATRAQTGGQFSAIVDVQKAGSDTGGPMIHAKETEIWYVVEGSYEFNIGGKAVEGGPGTLIAVDAGQPHSFKAKTDGKLLMIWTPGGFEQFFMDWDKQGKAFGPDIGAMAESYGVTWP